MENRYFSQYGQDEFLDIILFNKKQNGFFIEIGAHDGISFSNTFFFEKSRTWKGVCIEPNPSVFEKLVRNRKSSNLNVCIGDSNTTVKFTQIVGYSEMLSGITNKYDGHHLERIKNEVYTNGGEIRSIDVPMLRLESLPQIKQKSVDFISIDTEGSEFDIVKSIDFEKIHVKVLVIENNYKDGELANFLKSKNFILVASLRTDEVYIYKDDFVFRVRYSLFVWNARRMFQQCINKIRNKLQ